MSRALTNLHTSAAFIKPKSETSEPETSRISQEASTNATRTSSFSNFLLLAIAATANCHQSLFTLSSTSLTILVLDKYVHGYMTYDKT